MATEKQGSPYLEESRFLSQLDYQEQAGLISMALKKSSPQTFEESNTEDFKNELPMAFIQHKIATDPYYKDNPNKGDLSQNHENPGNTRKEEKDNSQQPSSDNLDPVTSLTQNRKNQEDSSVAMEESSQDIQALKFEDPFFNLDERLNLKKSTGFDFDPDDPVEENIEDIDNDDLTSEKSEDLLSPAEEMTRTSTSDFLDSTEEPSMPEVFVQENSPPEGMEEEDIPPLPPIDLPPVTPEKDWSPDRSDSDRETYHQEQPAMGNEKALYENYKSSLDKALDQKFKDKKIVEILKSYQNENQKIVESFLKNDEISKEEKAVLIKGIIAGKSQDLVVESINQKLFGKIEHEILERREKPRQAEVNILDRVFKSYQWQRKLTILILTTLFSLVLLFTIYFSYQTFYPIWLYEKTITAANNGQFTEAESFFSEAYSLKPDIEYTAEIGTLYQKKNRILEAEKKFQLLSKDFPQNLDALLANIRFYQGIKNFPQAREWLDQTKRLFPENIEMAREEVELLINEGKNFKDLNLAQERWDKADSIITDLLVKDPSQKGNYLQKKIEIAALSHNYAKAKNYYYALIQSDTPFEMGPMSTYLDFLIETQELYRQQLSLIPGKVGTEIENIFVINTIEQIFQRLSSRYGEQHLLEMYLSRWASLKEQMPLAQKHAEKSIALILKEDNYFLNEDLADAYRLLGSIKLKNQEPIQALEDFQKSLAINPLDPLANYYAGKINLLKLNQVQTAYDYLLSSYQEWRGYKNLLYADLLYTMGYINFMTAKNLSDNSIQEDYFRQSIFFWSELAKENLEEKNYLVNFNLGTGYLYLQKYELAEIFYRNNLKQLKNILNFYGDKTDLLIRSTDLKKEELQILSDVYNNLAIAQISKNSKGPVPNDVSGEALEYFITSIILKDKIGDLKGIPYANFHTLNDYPKKPLTFVTGRPFRISDASIPKTLLPESF